VRRWILWGALVVVAILFIVTYFIFDPSKSSLFPKCPFLVLTGYKCPGCGSQRAIHAILSGDIYTAWHFNAVLVIFLPIIIAYIVAEVMRKKWQRFYLGMNNPWVILAILFVFIGWWIMRNIFGW